MIVGNFKKITIGENAVILKCRNEVPKEILFSDVKGIFLKVKIVPFKYIALFVGLSMSAVLFLVWTYGFNLVTISPTTLILAGVIKLKSYKRYALKIKLKNGDSFIQRIPLKSKYKTIEDITKVRTLLSGIG